MQRTELLQKCKELGIKGVSSKNKKELQMILQEQEQAQEQEQGQCKEFEKRNISNTNTTFNEVIQELLIKTPKDKQRKVCKNCNELGHTRKSTGCRINIDKNNRLRYKIKKHILSQNCLENKTIDDYCNELSVLLNITPNLCKSLYNDIPLNELIDRDMNISIYLNTIEQSFKKCHECGKMIFYIQTNTHRLWNGNDICDTCWCNYDDYRNVMWQKIKAYRPVICEICGDIQKHVLERYHYDHLNMFNKYKSICSMVNEGAKTDEIYLEIDKCQILCLSCHHIVTDIERKLDFTRIKNALTRKLNQTEITEEEYKEQTIYYQTVYEEKMKYIYDELKVFCIRNNINTTLDRAVGHHRET